MNQIDDDLACDITVCIRQLVIPYIVYYSMRDGCCTTIYQAGGNLAALLRGGQVVAISIYLLYLYF